MGMYVGNMRNPTRFMDPKDDMVEYSTGKKIFPFFDIQFHYRYSENAIQQSGAFVL